MRRVADRCDTLRYFDRYGFDPHNATSLCCDAAAYACARHCCTRKHSAHGCSTPSKRKRSAYSSTHVAIRVRRQLTVTVTRCTRKEAAYGYSKTLHVYSALSRDRKQTAFPELASWLLPKIAVTSGQASQPAQFLKVDKELGEPQHPLGTAAKSRSWFGCADVPLKQNKKKRKKIRGLQRG